MSEPVQFELRCARCPYTAACGVAEMLELLAERGMLKRSSQPAFDLIHELFISQLPHLKCPRCEQVGLALAELDDGWETTRSCQSCGQPIAAERLEVLPQTQQCAACAATPPNELTSEYCPKCGALMSVRPSRGPGITRYELSCPDCR